MGERRDDDPQSRRSWAKALELMALAFVFPVATMAGFFAGRWLGGLAGHDQLGAIVGTVVGFVGGLWELYRTLRPTE